jgi:hypothetical protein
MTNALHNELIEVAGRKDADVVWGKVAEVFGPQMAFSHEGILYQYRAATLQLSGGKEPVAAILEGAWQVGDEIVGHYRGGIKVGALPALAELAAHYGEDHVVLSLTPVRRVGDLKAITLIGSNRLPKGLSFSPLARCDILPKPV